LIDFRGVKDPTEIYVRPHKFQEAVAGSFTLTKAKCEVGEKHVGDGKFRHQH
jgi:hypothetical protein